MRLERPAGMSKHRLGAVVAVQGGLRKALQEGSSQPTLPATQLDEMGARLFAGDQSAEGANLLVAVRDDEAAEVDELDAFLLGPAAGWVRFLGFHRGVLSAQLSHAPQELMALETFGSTRQYR